MSQSSTLTASFSGQSAALDTAVSSALSSQGFGFTLTGEPQSVYKILTSTNLVSWQVLTTVTNDTGLTQFLDTHAPNSNGLYYRVQIITP